MSENIVIIGAGQAGCQAVESLRKEGFTGPITMVGDEAYPPYQRPPLSKAYLLGTFERPRLFLKADAYYAEAGCELILNTSAKAIHRADRTVELNDGRKLAYDKLLLATGARVRKLRCPGADLPGIHYLKTIADVDGLQDVFQSGKRIAIVGGGYIGLEVAAVAAKRGLDVTVFEAMDRLMARAVSPQLSAFYAGEHEKAGVKLKLKTGVEAFEGNGKVERIIAGGQAYDCDIVLVGIGVIPCDELAVQAGLASQDGIVVDQNARTGDPHIWSAGDCTRHVGREGHEIRLECVQNAIDQAKHAALAMVGKHKTYSEVPWFWSDQYDLKLQIAGLARPTDTLVKRGDPANRKFAVFHLRGGKVAAVEAVNAAPEYMIGKKLVAEGKAVDPAQLADVSIPDEDAGLMAQKYRVTFVEDNGTAHTVEVPEGWSLMEGAVKHLIPGIDADCGGACACATCQVYVAPDWMAKLPPKSDMEETMLDFAPDVRPESRLSCQLRMSAALDGIVLKLPKSQH